MPPNKLKNNQYWVFAHEKSKTYMAFKKSAVVYALIMLGIVVFLIFGTEVGGACLSREYMITQMLCFLNNLFIKYTLYGLIFIAVMLALAYWLKPFEHSSAPTPPEFARKIK